MRTLYMYITMFIPLLLPVCLATSSLWTGIMNTLHREHQAPTTYFSHSPSLIKYIKSRAEAAEIVFICILAVKPQQIANNCKLLFSLSCCFFRFRREGLCQFTHLRVNSKDRENKKRR